MQYRLSCEQVSALINFYAEGELSELLKKYVKNHLETCPQCMAKYLKIQEVMKVNVLDESTETQHNTKQYADFKSKLSEYIDNELENSENLKIKKIAISNPLARRDLEDMYSFKRLMQNSFERTKNELKYDFTKSTMCKVKNNCSTAVDKFYQISALFFAVISFIICGIIVFLYL